MKAILTILIVLILLRIMTKPKTILLSYTAQRFQQISNSEFVFDMYYEKSRFFGILKYQVNGTYSIPEHANIKSYFDLWDNLIITKQPLK